MDSPVSRIQGGARCRLHRTRVTNVADPVECLRVLTHHAHAATQYAHAQLAGALQNESDVLAVHAAKLCAAQMQVVNECVTSASVSLSELLL